MFWRICILQCGEHWPLGWVLLPCAVLVIVGVSQHDMLARKRPNDSEAFSAKKLKSINGKSIAQALESFARSSRFMVSQCLRQAQQIKSFSRGDAGLKEVLHCAHVSYMFCVISDG